MQILLAIIGAGIFLSFFQSTRDGFLWLIAGALFYAVFSLAFSVSP